jgi:hypothetical protein
MGEDRELALRRGLVAAEWEVRRAIARGSAWQLWGALQVQEGYRRALAAERRAGAPLAGATGPRPALSAED